jgi:hypothetical protein
MAWLAKARLLTPSRRWPDYFAVLHNDPPDVIS